MKKLTKEEIEEEIELIVAICNGTVHGILNI